MIAHHTYNPHIRALCVLFLLFFASTFNVQLSTSNPLLPAFNLQLGALRAQDITVTVTPTQPILPPQVMLYITEPANYFNVTLSNSGKDDANIYLVMQVEQVNPSSGLSLSTPPRRQPKLPIVVSAGSTRILAPVEIRSLFNHIPLNEITAPEGLFDNYANGSFGLLPEGQYEIHMTAYRWDPALPSPVVASSPSSGVAMFSVCYNAQAPQFLTPMAANNDLLSVAEVNPLTPEFSWTAPVVACNPSVLQYTYSFRVVQVLPGQMPEQSMDYNPVVYQANNLSTPMCMIPQPVIKQMTEGATYAAQVTASTSNVNRMMLNYVNIANEGKSTYKLFRLNTKVDPVVPEIDDDDDDDDDGDDDPPITPEDEDDINIAFGDTKTNDLVEDSLYTFSNPRIRDPKFLDENGARKRFIEADLEVAWDPSNFMGGEGHQSDTIQIEYELQFFDNKNYTEQEEVFKQKPFYTITTKELKHTISWDDIKDDVEAGDYMVLRILPVVKKGHSIGFTGTDNIVDFALSQRLSEQYFQCEAQVEINDKTPTTKDASDFKGKVVAIGEYSLTIDEIKGSGESGFTGTGRVEWKPFGSKIMVCVKFDKLKINSADIVYEGVCETVAAPEMLSSMEVVDKLFSDWGIDNLIADTGIPYANQLQNKATSEIKSLAEKVDLGTYYKKLQDGKDLYQLLTTGSMDKLYFPVRFPKDILPENFDAVDIQIVDMKFSPTYATMNILGQATMPECDVLKSKLLVFGAPRVCISPDSFLPEGGQIALLGDFTLTPSADIEMTFKAPKDVLEPTDGCYIAWKTREEKTMLDLLGIDVEMKIADLVKDVGGKATEEVPVMHLQASVGSWDDLLVDHISIEDFQVKDLPGWTFQASDIVYDHSQKRNSQYMKSFPERYDKEKAGMKIDGVLNNLHWQGLHIGKVGVGFPKSLQLGDVGDKGDNRLWVNAKEMFWDQSGVTVTIGAENLFAGKEGTLGGWGISLDEAHVQIIQNDFDNAGFSGQINIPILKTATGDRASKDGKGGDKGDKKERFGNVDYSCQIRSLTPAKDLKEGEKARYSYVFLTENVGQLDFSFFVAQAELDPVQTYFVVEAYDDEKNPEDIKTQVELCMGGKIGIGIVDKANDWLKKKTESLPLELKIPDIHFTKMRLSNVQRGKWESVDERVKKKRSAREEAEQAIHDKAKTILMEANEINIGTSAEPFYFDLGEWSLASEKKHLGPFSFSLDKFSPSYSDGKVKLELGGTVGLIEDKIDVGAAVVISAKVNTEGDLKDWSIDDGDVEFKKLSLDLDFTAIHLKGELEATDAPNKGYKGTLDVGIIGFFNLDCDGGYFEHKKDEKDKNDEDYSWGYFKATLESALLRFDPVVIDRISGGFFFNCRPTKGTKKFNGDPTPQKDCIGIAFGLGLASSAGRETMSADLDMLVVYDSKNNCMSTFMLDGNMKAVGGMIKADCTLIYENEKNLGGKTQNRYLCLNVTVEAGADTKALIDRVKKANAALEALQGKLNDFQKELDPQQLYKRVISPTSDMSSISGNEVDSEAPREPSDDEKKELGITACKTEISLEFKITWVKDGEEYTTPKWHLYLGEPAKDKRCRFTFLKFDAKILSVDIGADAYLCLGNELPDGGALPPIPSTISEFLSGHKADQADMGADLGKAERSRKAAAKKLLDPNSCEGGVMIGASAWGHLKLDLGLLYGSIDAIAGFDAAVVNYGNNAFCVNSGSAMGYEGWYAMGQLYAYLGAELGVHIHIGSLINEKISILKAGIGGVLEIGLPNPTWIEGQARIKISLLGGLCKINKKFDFSAGDHCVPFKGNALDGFEMFQSVSHGSDSIAQALIDPTFAISLNEAKNMTFTTTSSIGSHYRLLDPSWESELKDKEETTEEELEKSMALNASRTYVFDINKDKNANGMKMGVRLFDLGDGPTRWLEYAKTEGHTMDEKELKDLLSGKRVMIAKGYRGANVLYYDQKGYTSEEQQLYESSWVSGLVDKPRSETVNEASLIMDGKEISNGPEVENGREKRLGGRYYDQTGIDGFLNVPMYKKDNEVNVSFREDKGTTFHFTNMDLKPGHSYMLVLSADAYEIDNGRRVWCEYYSEKDRKNYRIHWQQNKAWFFRIKGEEEEKIVEDSLRFLEPYVALAYPSTNGTRVVDNRGEGAVPAYFTDIMHPTIALNRDIRSSLPTSKMTWVLEGYTADGDTVRQERNAVYKVNGNCINLEPQQTFSEFNQFSSARNRNKNNYDFTQEQYRLRLLYTYFHKKKEREMVDDYYNGKYVGRVWADKIVDDKDSTFALVDLYLTPLPHHLVEKQVDGEWYRADNWLMTTKRNQTDVLAYSKPFVGGTIDAAPTIEYEKDYYNSRGNDLLTDEDIVFKNAKYAGIKNAQNRITNTFNLPYRLIDPYLYFAYLGKWVFIGDREISAYSFDNVPVKFGSESLIFNYNGTTVNCEFLKDKTNKSLLQLRKQMYGVWNTWNYNDSNHPKYPLPSVGGTVSGVTAANQDGKASTVTPLNINHYTDYTYVFEDLVKDYIGAYEVADGLCSRLAGYSRELVDKFYYWGKVYDSFNSSSFDKALNDDIKRWNSLHRGQYIEASSRGYSVRVPFYQLPLIFGDCFGDGAAFGNTSLSRSSRTFTYSVGQNDMSSGDPASSNLSLRWPSAASNLLFFRLNDGGSTSRRFYGYNARPFKYFEGDKWAAYSSCYKNSVDIEYDQFNVHKALQAVTGFKARLYRVDAYDIQKGQYIVSPSKNLGGGPWEKTVTIGTGNATASNMDKMYEANQEKDEFLRTHYDQPTPQAVWCEDENTLVFIVSDIDFGSAEGERIGTAATAGPLTIGIRGADQVSERRGWYNWAKDKCTRVVIDPSFKDADITTCYHWFYNFKKLQTVQGMENLPKTVTSMEGMFEGCTSLRSISMNNADLSGVTNMEDMFQGCTSLTSVSMNNAKTQNVTNMAYMFYDCPLLSSASFSSVNTAKVTDMAYMFKDCQSLSSVNLSTFNTSNVETMEHMFDGCISLTSLNLSTFSGESLLNAEEMFSGCRRLSSIDLRNFTTDENNTVYIPRMFSGCIGLRTLRIDAFLPNVGWHDNCEWMFADVTRNLTCYYHLDLDPRIVAQIPGTHKTQPDNRAKVIHGRYNNGKEALFFVYTTNNFSRNSGYNITTTITEPGGTTEKTDHSVIVLNVWTREDICDTGSSKPKWATTAIASAVSEVYIDDKFAALPRSTYGWFYDFKNLTEVHGLCNLRTEKVTDMGAMFYGCSSLTKVRFGGKNNLEQVTNMAKMFQECTELTSVVGLAAARLPKAKWMSYMFYHCESLESLPLNGGEFVTDMSYMYAGCTSFEYLGSTPTIVTDNVQNMMGMFKDCSNLRNTFGFTTTRFVRDMSYLYANCGRLREIHMGRLNTENVRNMNCMFSGCSGVGEINLGEMSSKSLTSCSNMFSDVRSTCIIYIAYDATRIINVCPLSSYPNRVLVYPASVVVLRSGSYYKLHFVGEKINLKKGDTYNRSPYSGYVIQEVSSGTYVQNRVRSGFSVGQDYRSMWNHYAGNVTEVTIDASFKKVELLNAWGYFRGMYRLTSINGLGNLNTSKAKDLGSLFEGCSNLTSLQGGNISTASATRTDYMFSGCSKLTALSGVQFGTTDLAYDVNHMFAGCSSLEEVGSGNYPRTGKAQDLSFMFSGCSSLTGVPVNRMKITSSAGNMESMFEGCTKLNLARYIGGVSSWETKEVWDMSNMFKGCSNVVELDLSNWNTRSLCYIDGMFAGCIGLRTLQLGTNSYFGTARKKDYSTYNAFTSDHDMVVVAPKEVLSDVKTCFTTLGFREGTTGQFYDKLPEQTMQAIWTKGNKTLTFFYGNPVGSTFDGYSVTKVWTGDDVGGSLAGSTRKWYSDIRRDVTKVVFDKTFSNARPVSTRSWFYYFSNLVTIEGIGNLRTDNVTDMSNMFYGCSSLKEIDLSGRNTSKVTNMSYLFSGCSSLKNINLRSYSNFRTMMVKNMKGMFSSCSALESLDLSTLQTCDVTSADYMFNSCSKLRELYVGSSFNFPSLSSKATGAFSGVSKLEIIVSPTDIRAVKDPIKNKLGFIERVDGTNGEFVTSRSIQAIWCASSNRLIFAFGKEYKAGNKFNYYTITNVWKVSGSSTPWLATVKDKVVSVEFNETLKDHPVSSCSGWFRDCSKLKNVYGFDNLNTSSCTSFSYMFYGCKSLSSLDVSKLDVSAATSLYSMFWNCPSLSYLNVSNWNTAKVTNMGHLFNLCKGLTILEVGNWDVSKVTNMTFLFHGCENLTEITGLDKWNTVSVTDMSSMFSGCKRLTTFNPTKFNTGNVKDMSSMFYGCEKWEPQGTSARKGPINWDVKNVTNMSSMFANCKSAKHINLSGWNFFKVKKMDFMFKGCSALTSINFGAPEWNQTTAYVTTMAHMFDGCSSLKNLDVSSFITTSVTDMSYMFANCTQLQSEFSLENFNLKSVTTMAHMFENCTWLYRVDLRQSGQMQNGVNVSGMFAGCSSIILRVNNNFRVTSLPANQSFAGGNVYIYYYSTDTKPTATTPTHLRTTLSTLKLSGYYHYFKDNSYKYITL